MACENCNKSPLTSTLGVGTMKEGARAVGPSDRKTRRANGPAAQNLSDFVLRLHSFARDWADVLHNDEMERALSALISELAEVLKTEYDRLHG